MMSLGSLLLWGHCSDITDPYGPWLQCPILVVLNGYLFLDDGKNVPAVTLGQGHGWLPLNDVLLFLEQFEFV
jgi:hypothetical protein